MDEAQRWKIVSQDRLHWRVWDGEFVVYDNGSGDTHLLSPEGAEILHLLSKHPASVEQVVQHMALKLNVETDESLYAGTKNALTNLDQLGLIQPVTP